MTFTQTDVSNLLTVLRSGVQNAQTATDIEQIMNQNFNFPISGNQQLTRALIKFAISKGNIIKSSTANPPGFWISNNKQEIIRNIKSLQNRAIKTNNSANNLKATCNTTYPNDLIT